MHVARSALGVRCVLASLLERNSLAERAARDVARFRLWTVAVSQKAARGRARTPKVRQLPDETEQPRY